MTQDHEPILDDLMSVLQQHLNLPTAFVMAVESYDRESGEPTITVLHVGPNAWSKVGMARAVVIDLEEKFRRWSDEE